MQGEALAAAAMILNNSNAFYFGMTLSIVESIVFVLLVDSIEKFHNNGHY